MTVFQPVSKRQSDKLTDIEIREYKLCEYFLAGIFNQGNGRKIYVNNPHPFISFTIDIAHDLGFSSTPGMSPRDAYMCGRGLIARHLLTGDELPHEKCSTDTVSRDHEVPDEPL